MKAILVINEMPDNCRACHYKCFEANLRDEYRPYWCPLKPMPNKKEGYQTGATLWDGTPEIRFNEYSIGWNDCLDEITGETE